MTYWWDPYEGMDDATRRECKRYYRNMANDPHAHVPVLEVNDMAFESAALFTTCADCGLSYRTEGLLGCPYCEDPA